MGRSRGQRIRKLFWVQTRVDGSTMSRMASSIETMTRLTRKTRFDQTSKRLGGSGRSVTRTGPGREPSPGFCGKPLNALMVGMRSGERLGAPPKTEPSLLLVLGGQSIDL